MARYQPSKAPMRVKIRDVEDLRQAMYFSDLNVRELSELCGSLRHRSTIGHLHSGARTTCTVALGKRIEKVLRVAPGSLFRPALSSVSVDVPARMTEKKAA